MPSDVHIEHVAHLQRASSQFVPQTGSMLHNSSGKELIYNSNNNNNNNTKPQSIQMQRYKALREAGFDDQTANKYSSMYSSVNEVIDAILSQSLAVNLTIENGNNNNIESNKSGKHSPHSIYNDHHLFQSRPELFPFMSDNEKQLNGSSSIDIDSTSNRHCHIMNESGKPIRTSGFNDSCETKCESNLIQSRPLKYVEGDGNERLDELCNNSLTENGYSSPTSEYKSSVGSDEYVHIGHYFKEDLSTINGPFNQNLLANVLKDGFFDSDEVNLEDEGMVDPNLSSKSPSAVSSSSSSGASSLLLESSSPSSFSSLSSSISTTPPNALNGFTTSLNHSCIADSLFTIHYNSNQSNEAISELNGKSKFAIYSSGNDNQNGSDLVALNSSNDSSTNGLSHLAESTILDALNKSILNYSLENNGSTECATMFGTSPPSPPPTTSTKNNISINNYSYNDFTGNKYPTLDNNHQHGHHPHNHQHQQQHTYNNGDVESHRLFDNPFTNQLSNGHIDDNFGKYLNHQHSMIEMGLIRDNFNFDSDKIFAGDEKTNDFPAYNGSIRKSTLFEYEQSNQTNDPFNFNLDRINKINNKSDLFGDYHYGLKETSFNTFGDNNCDTLFSPTANNSESDMFCGNSNSFSNEQFHNGRTFADIAASSLSSNSGKTSEQCFGAIGDCKLPKSSSISCTNLNMNSLNSSNNYFNLFGNGNSSSNSNNNNNNTNVNNNQVNHNSTYYESNGISTNKSMYGGQTQHYRTTMSSIGNGKYNGNSQPQTQQQQQQQQQMMNEQINFATQQPLRPSVQLNIPLGNMPNNNGQSVNGDTSGIDRQLNKPTNLMGYKGLWVCNISPEVTLAYLKRRFRRFGHFTGIQTFERRATNGSNIVFVHYDNPFSPVEAITCLHNYTGHDLCADSSEPLKLRFAPSMEQSRAGQLPTLEQARKMVERHGECFNWRLSSGCHRGIRCQLKHVLINKEIDSQPWVYTIFIF